MLILFFTTTILFQKIGIDIGFKTRVLEVSNSERIIISFTFVVLVILILNYMMSSKMFFDPYITRHNYLINSELYWLVKYFGNTSTFIPIIFGYCYSLKGRKIFLISFIIYLIYLILIGHKFMTLLQALLYFTYPLLILKYKTNKEFLLKRWYTLFSILIFAFFLNVIFYGYIYNPYREIFEDPFYSTLYRIAIQTHLWWGSVNYALELKIDSIDDILFGMDTLMYELTGIKRWPGDAPYTFGYPSILVYLFPWPFALVMHLLFMIYIGYFYGLAFKALKKRCLFPYLLALQITAWNDASIGMAEFYQLLLPRYLLVLGILIIILMITNRYREKIYLRHVRISVEKL